MRRRDARGEEPRPLEGHGDLTLEDVFANENPILGASAAVAGPLTMMLGTTSRR